MRARARIFAAVAIVGVACGSAPAPERAAVTEEAEASAADRYEATLAAIEAERARLAGRYAAATGEAERAAIRAEARGFVRAAIVERIVPAWLGMPWGLGANSTANRPHAAGQTVACGYFVAAVLEAAGLRLSSRFKYAQAAALRVQKSLAPDDVHRYFSVAGEVLADKIAGLGEGVYVIGLANHIGLVVVDARGVRLVHASYTGARVVTDEPLAAARAIADSRPKGYFVSPVMHDDRLADLWLRGEVVPLRPG